MSRERLDKALTRRGLVTGRERAQEHITAGAVMVHGIPVLKPAAMVDRGADIKLKAETLRYVSRGGLKLEQALRAFNVPIENARAIDVGASTGGFTDCLLQHGAASVHAVDVGYGQLAWKLRDDPRVVVLERTNIRHLTSGMDGAPFGLAVIDCSFIGLDKVLPHVAPLLQTGGDVVALVKPQFEAGREGVGKGGVVRDEKVREAAIQRVRDVATAGGFTVEDGVDCDTHGPSGNIEYLMHLRRTEAPVTPPELREPLD